MATKAIIVCTNEGKTIPEDYLKQIFEEVGPKEGAHSTLGIAFANEGTVEFLRDYTTLSKTTTDTLRDLTAELKSRAVFFFCRSDNPILEEDLQPFSLIEDEGKPELMAFCEGTFPNFEQGANAHTVEHFVVNDYLLEKIGEIYGTQSSLEATLKVMDTPVFRKDLTNIFVPRGVITLIAGNGEIMSFAKNPNAGSFEWGWTSDKLSYGTPAPAAEKEKPKGPIQKKPGSKMEELKAKLAEMAKEKPQGPVSSVPEVKETKTDTVIPPDAGKEPDQPPIPIPAASLRSRKELKKWMKRNMTYMPANWEDMKEVPYAMLKESSAYRVKKDFKEIANVSGSGVTTEVSLIIAPQQRKELMEKFIEKLQPGSDGLITQEKIATLEENYPTFSEQTNDYPISLVCLWSVDRISAFVDQFSQNQLSRNAIKSLINDMRYQLLEAHPEWMKQPVEDKEEPVEKPAEDKMAALKAKLAARKAM